MRGIGFAGTGLIGAKAVDILPRDAILPPAFNDLVSQAFGRREIFWKKWTDSGIKAFADES